MTLSSNLDSGRDSGGTPFLVRLVVVCENTNLGRPLLCIMTNRKIAKVPRPTPRTDDDDDVMMTILYLTLYLTFIYVPHVPQSEAHFY